MSPPEAPANIATFRIFGRLLATDLPLGLPACEEPAIPDWTLIAGHGLHPAYFEYTPSTMVYRVRSANPMDAAFLELHQAGQNWCLRYPNQVAFFWGPGGATYQLEGDLPRSELTPLVLGPLAAIWLEQEGVLCLHASAVALGNQATLLAAASGTGKSTMAAEFLKRGHTLITDDISAITRAGNTHCVASSFPRMKLHAASNELSAGPTGWQPLAACGNKDWWQASTGSAQSASTIPVGRIVLLERVKEGPVVLSQRKGSQALLQLVPHLFCARASQALGRQAEHLSQLAKLLAVAPLWHLRYASGYRQLCAAVDTLLDL